MECFYVLSFLRKQESIFTSFQLEENIEILKGYTKFIMVCLDSCLRRNDNYQLIFLDKLRF